MKNQIIISAKGNESRIALLENNELSQFFVESPEVVRSVGDVHLAEVHKVMGGIRAAFINIGQHKDAFLHFSDVGEHLIDYVEMLNGTSALDHVNPELIRKIRSEQKGQPEDNEVSGLAKQSRAADILRTGQKLLVQIVKEPMGSKGPRVSTDISLAGRFCVLIPFGNYVAVSKRIRSHKERRRLRALVQNMLPPNFGVIVRTVAGGQSDEVVVEDLTELLGKWNNIADQMHIEKPPVVLHRDLDMTESLIRDLFAKDYDRILIDDPAKYKQIKSYVQKVAPALVPNIKAYKGKEHIFDFMKIAADVESIYTPRVKMKSGGYLIFEQTEAMYVIDVNSGRYAAKKNQEENSLKTNLEAAREIAKQLRLRDIGGIIVVDFIDLKDEVNRKKVFDEIRKEFRKDKAKTNVLPMSDFGLVQITRQRIRPSINSSISKVCPMCGGTGDVVSQNTIITDIDAWLTKFRHLYKYRKVDLYVNPFLRGFLTRGWFSKRLQWMLRYFLKLSIYADETISMNDFKFTLAGSEVDITDAILNDVPVDLALKQSEESLAKSRKDPSRLDIYGNDDLADWSGVDVPSDDNDEDDENEEYVSRQQREAYRRDAREERRDSEQREERRQPRVEKRPDRREIDHPEPEQEAEEMPETPAQPPRRDLREMRADGTPRQTRISEPSKSETESLPEAPKSSVKVKNAEPAVNPSPVAEASAVVVQSVVQETQEPAQEQPAEQPFEEATPQESQAEPDENAVAEDASKADRKRKGPRSKYYRKTKDAVENREQEPKEAEPGAPENIAVTHPAAETETVVSIVQSLVAAKSDDPAEPAAPKKSKPVAKKKPIRKPRGSSPDDMIVSGDEE